MKFKLLSLCMFSLCLMGCSRTEYRNFRPSPASSGMAGSQVADALLKRSGGWKSYFVMGLVPGVKVMKPTELCGAVDNIDSIRTRQTFFQGLIGHSYVGLIYSPWNSFIYCKNG